MASRINLTDSDAWGGAWGLSWGLHWEGWYQPAGTQESTGSGALLAQAATVAGAGVSESTGTGVLWAANSLLAQGLESAGTGALEAQPTTVAGAGRAATAVLADVYIGPRGVPKTEPAVEIVGHGNLRAGPTHIRGTGQVTWQNQNELALLLLAA